MIEATVGDLLDGTLWDIRRDHIGEMPDLADTFAVDDWQARHPKVYVVRDGDVVFYVGQSDDPVDRLLAHAGLGAWGHLTGTSSLGRTIEDNLPSARGWTIELWTVQECKEALVDETTESQRWDKDLAEEEMILRQRPYLNAIHNRGGYSLPERYRKNTGVGAARAVLAAFGDGG